MEILVYGCPKCGSKHITYRDVDRSVCSEDAIMECLECGFSDNRKMFVVFREVFT